MTFTAAQLSNAVAIAHKYIEKNVPVLFAMAHPLMDKMMERKEYADGERLQFPLNFNKMQNVGFISGTTADVIDTNTQQNLTYAELDWKKWNEGFSITLDELVRASGDNAVKNIITAKTENTLESIKDFIQTGFYGSATTNTLAFNGLADIFAASGTAYAGLTDTDFGNDVAGDNLFLPNIDTTLHYCSYSNISPKITKIKSKGQGAPDYMISNSNVFQAYKSIMQAAGQRYVGETELKSGFDSIKVDGVTWLADDYAPGTSSSTQDNYLYIISSKTFGIKYKFGFGKASPMDSDNILIPNQPVIFKNKYGAANIYCNNRRLNAVFKALQPSATS